MAIRRSAPTFASSAQPTRTSKKEVAQKKFREDLFYRLNVVRIHLPPLRSRQEDIRQLAEYFLQKIAHQKHRPPLKLSEEAARVLEDVPVAGECP